MPSKTPKQAKFMRAIAHGWTPSRMKSPPSRAVAQEFVEADRKYSGGFAENRYWTGGLAAMNEVNSGVPETLNWQRGGRTRRNGGGGGGVGLGGLGTESPYTAEEQAKRDAFLNMDIQPDGVWSTMLHRIQQQNLPPPESTIAAPTTAYSGPRRGTRGGRRGGGGRGGRRDGGGGGGGGRPPGGGPGTTPPRIIETDPASYVGASADVSGREESPYRDELRAHQARIAATLGSARGGHVNYYQEGGAARPGHAEGPNPFEGKNMPASYSRWERENHIDPPPPPEVAAEVEEEGGVGDWLRGLFTPDPETAIGSGAPRGTIEEQMEEMEQAYGGRVRYQTGGLATAAPGRILPPAGGVPPWIEPIGSGPGYMEPEPEGYQFGGAARGYRGVPPQRGGIRRGVRQPRGGRFGRYGGAPRGPATGPYGPTMPQRGGLAAMMQQAQAQQAGAAGNLPPGIDPRAVAADREGLTAPWQGPGPSPMDPRGPLAPGGGPFRPGGGVIGKPMPRPGTFPPGGGGNIPPYKQLPGRRIAPPPGKDFSQPLPDERGPVGGGVVGGPRVPPNMTGFLQKMRMQNRPPSGPVGGGGNRVGMQDQQGALSRALQRGTGRPPMSRRSAFGRAQ